MTLRRPLAATVLVASVIGTVAFVAEGWGTPEFSQHLVFGPAFLGYPVVATVILWRRDHPVGRLLLLLSMTLVCSYAGAQLIERPTPPGTSTAWRILLAAALTPFPLAAMLLPALGLRFPDGRPVSPRWRYLELAYVVGVVSVVTAMLLSPVITGGEGGSDLRWTLANPLSTPWTEPVRRLLELVATATLPPAILGAGVAVVVRFRRSTGVARQQLRWLTYGLLTLALTWPVVAGSALLVAGHGAAGFVSGIYPMLLFALPPVGMGVAITRYRLYDLDRLVSRTLSYALVTVILAAMYAGAVVGLSSLVRLVSDSGGDLAVAGSTLLVAAAFQPVRRRVQAIVDRRFNRRRVDGLRAVEDFGRRLRDEVELRAVVHDLRRTVRGALEPAVVSVVAVRGTEPR